MEKIWIVGRTEGEYSDRSETPVCWFPDEAAAQAYVKATEPLCRDAAQRWRRFLERKDYDYTEADRKRFRKGLPDPTFDPTSYGADDASYWVWELPAGIPV